MVPTVFLGIIGIQPSCSLSSNRRIWMHTCLHREHFLRRWFIPSRSRKYPYNPQLFQKSSGFHPYHILIYTLHIILFSHVLMLMLGFMFSFVTNKSIDNIGVRNTFLIFGAIQFCLCGLAVPMYLFGKRARGWSHRRRTNAIWQAQKHTVWFIRLGSP